MNISLTTKNIAILVVVVLGGWWVYSSVSTETTASETTSQAEEKATFAITYLGEEETEAVYYAFLGMLSDVYFVSQENSTAESGDMTSFLYELLKANTRLDDVISRASEYANHSNDIVELAGKGISVGSYQIKEANNDIITYLRGLGNLENFDISEFQYQLANYRAAEHEGYVTIITSVGQLMALTFRSVESENPTGPIPYTINKSARQRIVSQIDDLFTEAFVKDETLHQETQTRNAIVLLVKQLRENLIPNTYEEIP